MEHWEQVYGFWFGNPGTAEHGTVRDFWFGGGPETDREIRERFEHVYGIAAAGGCREWMTQARGCVSLIVLLDQFPRNMYRGEGRAFASDGLALEAARQTVSGPIHDQLMTVERLFAYLPFEHSESLVDQEESVRLFTALEDHEYRQEWIRYAEDHRVLIQRFGRFPHRNALLGRDSTPEETSWLASTDQRFGAVPAQENES